MRSHLRLLVCLAGLGPLTAGPVLAAAPEAAPKPAAKSPAKSSGTKAAPGKAAAAPAPAAKGSCGAPCASGVLSADARKSCGSSSVADLAIDSMGAGDDPDWKPAPLPFTWDVPRAVNVIPMSDVIEANGFPVKLSAVLSTERPEVILQHMVNRFQDAGLYIPPDEHQPQMLREPQLTALDPMGLISYTFILQPNGNGTTTVILGETNVGKRRPPSSDVAPIMPGATGVLHSRQESVRTLAYAVATPLEEVRAFYTQQLTTLGYQQGERGVWRKGSDELSLSLHPGEGGQTAVVIIRRPNAAPPTPDGVVD